MSGSGDLRLALIIEAVDNATAKLKAVNAQIEKANAPMNRLKASAKDLLRESGWNKLQGQFKTINERASTLGNTIRGYALGFAAITAAAGGVFSALKSTIDQVDHINDSSKKLGITTEQLTRMGYAAQLNGSSLEEMDQSLTHLSRSMVEASNGSKEMQLWFARVGIPIAKLRKMNAAQVMEAIADKFAAVGDAGQNAEKKLALLAAVTGRSSLNMKQLLDGGSAAMREMYKEADRLGATVSGTTASAMADFNDDFDRLKTSIFGVAVEIARGALPALDDMVKKFTDMNVATRQELGEKIGKMIGELVARLPGFLTSIGEISLSLAKMLSKIDDVAKALGGWDVVIKSVAAILGAKLLVDFGLFIASVAAAIPTLVTLSETIFAIGAGMLASPFGLVIAGIAAVAAGAFLVYKYWEPIKKLFLDLWDSAGKLISRVTGWFGGGTPGGATGSWGASAASVPNAIVARGGPYKEGIGGTLDIRVTSEGKARVTGLTKTPGSPLDLDVYTGSQMVPN